MDNGTALEYLKNQQPEVDTLSMVSLREVNTILLQIAVTIHIPLRCTDLQKVSNTSIR